MADTEPILDLSELLEMYKLEARQTVARLQELLRNWADIAAGGAARLELRKLSHQLRGSGRTYGFREVTRVAKAIEHIVERIEKGRVAVDARVRTSLQQKVDRLERAFQA